MVKYLLYLWQFPQVFIGFCIMLYFRLTKRVKGYYVQDPLFIKQVAYTDTFTYWITDLKTEFTMGCFVFLNGKTEKNEIRHLQGHCMQSLFLGPFYLAAVCLPILWSSLFINKVQRRKWTSFHKYQEKYMSYPENWADKLGCAMRVYNIRDPRW